MHRIRFVACAAAAIMACTVARGASAMDHLRVGDPSVNSFSFLALAVGLEKGIFQKAGVDFERISVSGSAKLHQAMIAGSLDIAVGAGTDMAFAVKGAPEIAVAAMAGPPLLFGFVVRYDAPYKKASDLKGARFGISTGGSLTEWLVLRLASQQGWKRDDVTLITVGADTPGQIAALVTNQVDTTVSASAMGMQLAEDKRGRLLFPASDLVHDFIMHVIFASNDIVEKDPEAVRHFLKGWFDTIAWMRQNRAETVTISRGRTHYTQPVEEGEYDLVMPMFSDDGKFVPSAVKVMQTSFVDLKILDTEPDLTKYYTEKFLPKK